MQIVFSGLCSGTETKHSNKSGNDYQVTSFVEMPTMRSFQFFGDFDLKQSLEVKQYIFEASLDNNGKIQFPQLVAVNPAPVSASPLPPKK